MASYSETTAISLRKGSHTENLAFTGVLGEVTFDTGVSENGTDVETTLRIHNGITQGGIAIARADLANITTKALAENRQWLGDSNLAYSNLSNLEALSSSTAIQNVLNILHSYGLATDTQIEDLETRKANADMSNVVTSTLAEGRVEDVDKRNGNLAYANMSNVNTKYLAGATYRTGSDGDKPLGYADESNVDTTNLTLTANSRPAGMQGPVIAAADLSNVNNNTINDRITALNVEYNTNKDTSINPQSPNMTTHYPTIGAVVDYVSDEIENLDFIDPYFKNTKSWGPLYISSNTDISFDTDSSLLLDGGTGFTTEQLAFADNNRKVSTLAPTDFNRPNILSEIPIQIAIYTLDSGDDDDPTRLKPATYRLYPEYGTTSIEEQSITFVTENGSELIGTIKAVAHPDISGVYKYVFTKDSITGYDWKAIPENIDMSILNAPKYNSMTPINVMPILCAEVLTVDESGVLTEINYIPTKGLNEVSSTLITIHHPLLADETVQIGNNASATLQAKNILPTIGGAGLLKSNLNNLPGMTDDDIISNNNAAWTINKSKVVNRASVTIPTSEYNRLVTAGQLWDTVKNTTAITIRKWA